MFSAGVPAWTLRGAEDIAAGLSQQADQLLHFLPDVVGRTQRQGLLLQGQVRRTEVEGRPAWVRVD